MDKYSVLSAALGNAVFPISGNESKIGQIFPVVGRMPIYAKIPPAILPAVKMPPKQRRQVVIVLAEDIQYSSKKSSEIERSLAIYCMLENVTKRCPLAS